MNARTTMYMALIAAGTVLFTAACEQRNAATGSAPPTPGTTSMSSAAEKTGEHIDDAALTTKVKAALMAEPGLRSLEINVDTRDNVVVLNGTVDSYEKKQRAMQVAQGVQGVKSVSDNLVVKSS